MTLRLNDGTFGVSQAPANIELLTDPGSIAHLAIGFLAGTRFLTAKDAVLLLAAFAGYQISQAACGGEPWSRIGGELIEFALGMLLARFLPV